MEDLARCYGRPIFVGSTGTVLIKQFQFVFMRLDIAAKSLGASIILRQMLLQEVVEV